MAASLAATEQARRLDPRIRTSGAHTHFMLGEYEKVLDFQPETVPYMPNLARVMLGRTDQALHDLSQIDTTVATRLVFFTEGLRLLIKGAADQALEHVRRLTTIPDPEGRWYVARMMVQLGAKEEALELLGPVVEQGFFCLAAFTRDPWLDPIRGTPEFTAIVRRAEARHRQALISFLNAEGDRILGVAHPV